MAKKPAAPATSASSNMSTAHNREMTCHSCGNPGHFKRDCPNRKVIFINEETDEYETGDDEDPAACDDEGYNSEDDMYVFLSPALLLLCANVRSLCSHMLILSAVICFRPRH